jgi:hypothetical protein
MRHTFQEADRNGILWIFPKQQYNFSCGPTCLRYVKLLVHNETYSLVAEKGGPFTEGKARKLVFKSEAPKAFSPNDRTEIVENAIKKYPELHKDPKSAIMKYLYDRTYDERKSGPNIKHDSWAGAGTRPEALVEALKQFPMPVMDARLVTQDYKTHLMKTTPRRPAILGVQWTIDYKADKGAALPATEKERVRKAFPKGGHFVCCVGPTKQGNEFIFLDPMDGIIHVHSDNVEDAFIFYPNGSCIGRVRPEIKPTQEPQDPHDLTGLVDFHSRAKLSTMALIVTYPQG